jgi:hypothetical protein
MPYQPVVEALRAALQAQPAFFALLIGPGAGVQAVWF